MILPFFTIMNMPDDPNSEIFLSETSRTCGFKELQKDIEDTSQGCTAVFFCVLSREGHYMQLLKKHGVTLSVCPYSVHHTINH